MKWFTKKETSVSFEEILLDSSNLPLFNTGRLEGRIELPLSYRSMYGVGVLFTLIALIFFGKLYSLQVTHGEELTKKGEQNRLEKALIIAERGPVYDTRGELIIWNEIDQKGDYNFPVRAYADTRGIGQLIGYVSYPQKDRAGFYFRTEYVGRNGVEEAYNTKLQGQNGHQLVEVNALGEVLSESMVEEQQSGKELVLSVDAGLSQAMYDLIATTTKKNGFRSGAGAMIDVRTGEIIAMTSFPSYDPEVLADGDDGELIESYNNDPRFPYLNKVVSGLYTPGSIVKPFVAYGALVEGVISPEKVIVSRGQITVPNPYDPDNPAIFRDWRDSLGAMTIRDAIALSSNVFMMAIGGGYEDQRGLGITKLTEYYHLFGIGSTTGIELMGEEEGVIPDPAWKERVFDDDWRLGDTYLMSIGQYAMQATPLQMLRAYAAIANGGYLVTPHVEKGVVGTRIDLHLKQSALDVVRDGMRHTVIQEGGTARALERNDIAIAAKSGTAELGASKSMVNSWIAGYFPYEEPKYAFILMMEYGPRTNTVGASRVMGSVFDWISINRPEYLKTNP